MDDIRIQPLNMPPQTQITKRIKFPPLPNDRHVNASLAQLGFERAGMSEYCHMHIEPVSWQACRQQSELFFSSSANQRRNNQKQTNQGGDLARVRFEPL